MGIQRFGGRSTALPEGMIVMTLQDAEWYWDEGV